MKTRIKVKESNIYDTEYICQKKHQPIDTNFLIFLIPLFGQIFLLATLWDYYTWRDMDSIYTLKTEIIPDEDNSYVSGVVFYNLEDAKVYILLYVAWVRGEKSRKEAKKEKIKITYVKYP